jgi:hypothetical protein
MSYSGEQTEVVRLTAQMSQVCTSDAKSYGVNLGVEEGVQLKVVSCVKDAWTCSGRVIKGAVG